MTTSPSIEEQAVANLKKLLHELFSTPRNPQIAEPYKGIAVIANFSETEMIPVAQDFGKFKENQMLLQGEKDGIEKASETLGKLGVEHEKRLDSNSRKHYIVLDKNDPSFKEINRFATEVLKRDPLPMDGLIDRYMIRNNSWLDLVYAQAESQRTR